MKTECYMQKEQRALQKLINFRLPRQFMTVGIVLALIAIVFMFLRKPLFGEDSETIRFALQKVLLVGMLIMSITRDKEEDEMIVQLRMQSYAWAFVTGVIYALIMPYVEFGVSSVVNEGNETFKNLGDFQVLLFMLLVQLMCYHVLKRYR
ncbi:MAG: hypothetical protein ED556_06190 [Winogradskyella sp.]|uniref:hypothetical protein n=1 Tax=Winogradskyella sp. TaxID=1883156 RepID=UPI000F3BA2F1|nr:hypothetical protein [Winogradskyella sp.]RNC87011.1 MAG: hypothetical protein ED556_06190 [Winogradskyella sp.]